VFNGVSIVLNKRLIQILADGKFHSGSEIGKVLEVSRAAVWKQIKKLGDFDLTVHAVPGKGYQIPGGIDLVDRERILNLLEQMGHNVTSTLETVDVVDSTNHYVLDKVVKTIPDRGPWVCVAESQIAGRARYGRIWGSPYGANVYLSVGGRVRHGVESLDAVNSAASIAVMEALNLKQYRCAVKWPNAIVARGKRLGNVQVELKGESTGPCCLVLGVNLNLRPPSMMARRNDSDEKSYLLDIAQGLSDRNQLVAEIADSLLCLFRAVQTSGVQRYLDRWAQYDDLAERPVRFVSGDQQLKGRALGIDSTGRLRLQTESGGIEALSGGEVEYLD